MPLPCPRARVQETNVYEQILYEVADPVATITLNRPAQLNAWTDRMAAEVKHAMARAEADPQVVVIVVTGAGRGFCAGADLKRLQALSAGERSSGRGDRPRRRSRRSRTRRLVPRHLHLPDVDPQAGGRGGERRLRGHGGADRALLRRALRLGPRGLHHRVLAPRTGRRVGPLVAAAARSSGPRTRSICSSPRARSAARRPSASAS